jgi:transposase
MNPGLVLMQDGAPGHSAGETQTDLQERDITPVFWPAYSPDLNPIETLWNIMKNYLELHHPEPDCSYDQLRAYVKEAWDSIMSDQLLDLLKTMPMRCEDVIAAEGGHTK